MPASAITTNAGNSKHDKFRHRCVVCSTPKLTPLPTASTAASARDVALVCVWQCCSHMNTNIRTQQRRPGSLVRVCPSPPAPKPLSLSPLPTGGPVTAQRRAATHTHPPHAMGTHTFPLPIAQCVESCEEPGQPACSCSPQLQECVSSQPQPTRSQPQSRIAAVGTFIPRTTQQQQCMSMPEAFHTIPSHNYTQHTHEQGSTVAAVAHIWLITEPCALCDPYWHMRLSNTPHQTPHHNILPACHTSCSWLSHTKAKATCPSAHTARDLGVAH